MYGVDTISPPLTARCCHVANNLTTSFTGERQTNRRTDKQRTSPLCKALAFASPGFTTSYELMYAIASPTLATLSGSRWPPPDSRTPYGPPPTRQIDSWCTPSVTMVTVACCWIFDQLICRICVVCDPSVHTSRNNTRKLVVEGTTNLVLIPWQGAATWRI